MSTVVNMSPADYLAGPEDHDTEWSRGAMLVGEHPTVRHQYVVGRLSDALGVACPPDLVAVHRVGWLVRPAGPYRVPDVVVLRRNQIGSDYLCEAPVLVVEVLSPGEERAEVKVREYAGAGLLHQSTVDPTSGPTTVYRNGAPTAETRAGHVLHIEEPFPVDVDPAGLLP